MSTPRARNSSNSGRVLDSSLLPLMPEYHYSVVWKVMDQQHPISLKYRPESQPLFNDSETNMMCGQRKCQKGLLFFPFYLWRERQLFVMGRVFAVTSSPS
ncbi:hypothetical protein E4U56_006906 [Claviceps arundinis]|uniref:Uncharacterized protein n=1 Tax=Claviceps arundinis TaxID=1623583 RepID=A0A9P7N012_9HYPO|nr:hypothetical protein E4U56_006906 [Claviceps arundinis]